ncbi:hypothetical protein GH733_004874 [Mirounga leonina]|nr:hypothetical protein GH733_004874 [Mirounga leonina]
MKIIGGLLLLCTMTHFFSNSGKVMEKFSFFMKEDVNFSTDMDVECAPHPQQVDCSKYKKSPPGKDGFCHAIYAPICGSDGKTYPNDCFFCFEVQSGSPYAFLNPE